MCVCMSLRNLKLRFLWRVEEGIGPHGAGVTGIGELLDVSAEN